MNDLPDQIARTAIIKQEMTELLRTLEAQVTKKPVSRSGTWRHHTQAWLDKNPPPSSSPST